MAPKVDLSRQASEQSDACLYALTITYLPTYQDKEKKYKVTPQEREKYVYQALNYVLNKCHLIEKQLEDKEGKPHLHCTVATKVKLYPYPKIKNYRLHFVPVYGLSRWTEYINKEQKQSIPYSMREAESYFKTNYAFNTL